MSVTPSLRQKVAERDRRRCSYCLTSEAICGLAMHVDHVIPEVAGGKTREDNLCLACFSCNVYKGAQQTALDPLTGERAALFHPVEQRWDEHFAWSESQTEIVGLTACGRSTVAALKMNHPAIVCARRRWVAAGWHPP
ncbi:MAG: HNH endonuclease [Thermoanaerobaculia bacterium]|nr:HNH endonuclease [Thermoanaerobaculia bacterium]